MKNILYTFLIFVSLLITAASCDNGDDNLGDTSVKASNPTMTVSIPTTNSTFVEKDTTFNITVTLSEFQMIDTYVYLNVVGGNATDGEDFSLSGNRIIIPAYTKTGTGAISFSADSQIEDDETVTLQIGDARTVNATLTPVTAKFTVQDATVPSEVKFSISWASTFVIGEEEFHTDELADLDFYVYDEAANNVIGLQAATGDEPEEFTLPADLADGTYEIAYNPWNITTTDITIGGDPLYFPIPLVMTVTREAPAAELELEIDGLTTDKTLFFQNDGTDTNAYNEYVIAKIVKTGDTFEIFNAADESQGSLRLKYANAKRKK